MTSAEIKRLLLKYMKASGERDHAKLSASASERWLGCPASVSLSVGRKQVSCEAGGIGTNAHTLFQFILENEKKWRYILFHEASTKFRAHIGFNDVQLKSVMVGVKFVLNDIDRMTYKARGKRPHLWIERKVHLEGVGFGTTDVMLWQPFGELHVIDYKNGKYKVSPENNSQGLYYGVAAADEVGWDFSKAQITIVQPNASGKAVKTWKNISPERFEKAKLMFLRGAERTRGKNPAVVPNHKYCWFCPARPVCPAHADKRREKVMSRF